MLLAYAKITLYSDLLDSKVPDDPYLGRELGRYFPKLLMQRFPEAVEKHRLRREIIATHIVNSIINRGGPSLVVRMADETGAQPDAIVRAFVAVRDSYGMPDLNGAIDALDSKIPGKLQLELYAAVQDLLLDRLVWFLRNADFSGGLDGVISHYKNGIAEVEKSLGNAMSEEAAKAKAERVEALKKAGVPEALAVRIANLPALAAATDIVLVGDRTARALPDVAATYFAARDFFRVDRIADAAQAGCDGGLFRSPGARPVARRPWRGDTAIDGGDAGGRQGRPRGGRRLDRSARRECRAHPRRRARNRRYRAHACRSCRWRRACWAIWRGNDGFVIPGRGQRPRTRDPRHRRNCNWIPSLTRCSARPGMTINAGNAACR